MDSFGLLIMEPENLPSTQEVVLKAPLWSLFLSLQVPVPALNGAGVHSTSSDFDGDSFIFATEEGTIVGWQAGLLGTIRSDQSGTGLFIKGLLSQKSSGHQMLYAADFHNNKIDVFRLIVHTCTSNLPFSVYRSSRSKRICSI